MLGRERPDHAERGQVDALDLQAGAFDGGGGALDHLLADGDDDDALAQAERRVDGAERLEVEDRLVHRHRDVIGRGGLDGRGQRLRIVIADDVEIERAHDDALVGDPEAHPLGQLVLREEGLEHLRQSDRVGDLAVAHDAGRELGDGAAGQGEGAIDAHFGGGEVARVELEAHDAGVRGLLLLPEHRHSSSYPLRELDRAITPFGALNARSGPEGPLREELQLARW